MWMRITSVDPSLPTRSPVAASSANTTGLPASVVSCVSSAGVSTSTIEPSRLAGTSLPNVTFATPVVSVRLSVESRLVRAAGTSSRLRVATNPSSSTVRLVVERHARHRIRRKRDRYRRRRAVAVAVGDRVGEAVRAGLPSRRRVGEGAVVVVDRRALGRPPSSPQRPSKGQRRQPRTRHCRSR